MRDFHMILGVSGILILVGGLLQRRDTLWSRNGLCFILGVFPGILLGTMIYCGVIEAGFVKPGGVHLLAVVSGMGLAMVFEKGHIPWLLTGFGAGAQVAATNRGAYLITGAASVMLVAQGLFRREKEQLFLGALLFFAGQIGGYLLKEAYLPAQSLLFALGGGGAIYLASSKIMPEKEISSFRGAGGIAGFILTLLIY